MNYVLKTGCKVLIAIWCQDMQYKEVKQNILVFVCLRRCPGFLHLLVKNSYKSDNWQAVKYLVWSDRSNWNDPYWGKMWAWPLTARQIVHQPFSYYVWIFDTYDWWLISFLNNCTFVKKTLWKEENQFRAIQIML